MQKKSDQYNIFKNLFKHTCKQISDLQLTKNSHNYEYIQGVHTSYLPLWILALQNTIHRDVVVVLPSDEESLILAEEINMYNTIIDNNGSGTHAKAHMLPSWACVVGTALAQYASSRLERSHALHAIVHALEYDSNYQKNHPQSLEKKPNNNHQHGRIIVCNVPTFNQLLPPRQYINKLSIDLRVGQKCDPTKLAEILVLYNFLRTPHVTGAGEFSVRGELIDIFIYSKKTYNAAWRIRFDFEVIESIEVLPIGDNTSNNTKRHIKNLKIYPLVEHIWHAGEILQDVLEQTASQKNVLHMGKKLLEVSSVVLQNTFSKLESQNFDEYDYLYYPFMHKTQSHITQYCNGSPLILRCNFELLSVREEKYKNEYRRFFLESSHVQCVPRPERIWGIIDEYTKSINTIKILHRAHTAAQSTDLYKIGDSVISGFAGNIKYFEKQSLKQMNNEAGDKCANVVLCTSGEQQQERVRVLVSDEVLTHKNFCMCELDIKTGFMIKNIGTNKQNIFVYGEADVLGRKLFSIDTNLVEHIASIDTINTGDLVVHIQYGIAAFCGLKRMNIQGSEKDFMHLQYKDNESLYVPIEQMNMVQKYIGKQSKSVMLDKIGGGAWERRKKKVIQQVEDLSEDLLKLQAQRNTKKGFAFPPATEWEEEFIKQFPFPETKDQIKTWQEIEVDMKATYPMDRVLVGDVGFGKTELAFRAAFKAISTGKQVAFLVPTTILAEQHYQSAQERCKNFPISIGLLSRFVDKRRQKQTIAALGRGEVEFLIGTHRILQADVLFYDIGLVIIDEEHRFGVKDKERIKQFKNTVDCLALSATPIPRTLYQSLIQVRHLSTLATAPNDRKPIKTFVEKYTDRIVKHAIEQEIERKGQVFFLHNRVRSLEEVKMYIQTLVPRATVLTASGQMNAKELEDTMYTFVHGGANVLVATTIIENGIDIPTVNTIIIDRADMYGVSQLYQLRGRVGRSDKVAYAYLLYPGEDRISDIALKRLTTISDYTELGSGFHIAMQDLEVRGAGNLLGKEQSGSIFSVGYEYYLQLLDRAVQKVSGNMELEDDVVLDLYYTGFIPSSYVVDSATKMDIYRRISRIKTQEEYDKEIEYLNKTYGPIPVEIDNLLCISKIKIISKKLHITMLKDRNGIMDVYLNNLSLLTTQKIMYKNIIKLIADGKIRVHHDKPNVLRIPYDKNIQLETKYALLEKCLLSIIGTS